MSIRESLINLGVKPSNQKFTAKSELPDEVIPLISVYINSVVFEDDIEFEPQHKTGLEDSGNKLTLEVLWGVEVGQFNIFTVNESLKNLEADESLFSIGESFGGNHICLSKGDGKVYLFVNDSEQNAYLIFNNLEQFVESLNVQGESNTSSVKASSIQLDF
ncbi:SMI1/KNR4 family protein [Vibrio campbellii]|uniref:Knr4/Smi1-like domain-containing protein n=1 Tax=Vibrio campbellii TaxID=680 RepID=A0ABY5ILS7_9VIBR|nr:SMI1/KNR4 family protein [Vibrio campbellii]MCC4226254.1 SMI1/KNR4 family protein [Vibrio campbellii]RDX38761.1 hypothetical protein DZA51_00910 [Vibrio campbellii]UTZ25185.1 hypothetical protein HB760_25810 [Vibrio campbellii]UTZ25251.1 hypothetical protein HB760_26220 [Vibrio campbellii]UTZ35180.1 hypothetical protein HB762_28375 [Vibrio campbellii]